MKLRAGLLLFFGSFLLYNLNLREISSQDTIPTRLLPVALIRDGTLTLDGFFVGELEGTPLPPWVQRVGGRYHSGYPILPALLALPIYLVPISLLGGDSWALINLLAKLSASLIAALSVLLVYLSLRRLGGEATALGIALVYALGTSTWSVSSQGLWGHGTAQFLMAAGIYCALRGEATPGFFHGVGLTTGLMVSTRPTTAMVGVALLAYGLRRDPRHGVRALLPCAGVLLAVLGYHLRSFGSPFGGYATLLEAQASHYGIEGVWATPLAEGLLGLLVSPSRGLLVYSPVLALALGGVVLAVLDRRGPLLPYLAAGFAGSLLLLGKYSIWWGGHTFGPRYLVDFLPLLAIFLLPAWRRQEGSRPWRVVVLALFAISIAVQLVGAFYYPSPRDVDWNTAPRDVDVARERLWDWRDPQILRLLRNGPRPMGFASPD